MRRQGEDRGTPRLVRYCLRSIGLVLGLALLLLVRPETVVNAASETARWPGVDEAVIEKVAKEHGRPPVEPFINTDQDDLLLFLFLLAGAIGGFIAGYNWRKLTEKRESLPEPRSAGNGRQD